MNPDISFVADVALAAFTSDDPLQTGGHDPNTNGFHLQQLEMAIGSAVDPYFRLDGNVVFSLFGVEIEEIYATTQALPWRTQLRVGQFLTRFGRLNATHPHAWDFVDQPFPNGRVFGGEGNRGLGVEGSVLLPLPWSVEIAVSETMIGGEATARSWADFAPLRVEGPLDLQTTAVIEQFFPFGDDWSLLWGLSYAGGPNGTGRANRSEVYGADLYLKFRPLNRDRQLALQAEAFYRRRQVPEDVLVDLSGYGQVVWRISRRWGTGARYELGTPAVAAHGVAELDRLDADWTEDRHRISVQGTFFPTEFSRIRAQTAADLVGWRERPDLSAFLACEFTIGAHGAHSF